MKPRGKIDTPAKAEAARVHLGASKAELARTMRLGEGGRDAVRLIEQGKHRIPGPYQLALEALVAGWRPWGVRLPIDKEEKSDG